MKLIPHALLSVAAFASLFAPAVRANNMATIAITPATGAVTLVPRWSLGAGLAGFHEMAEDLSLGGGANQFYSVTSSPVPAGGSTAAFVQYIAASGSATPNADIGSKLTPNSYSALTSADPDVGYGPVNFYFIHHTSSGDYFSVIVPGSGTSSAVRDLKPMSGPGGPGTLGAGGYFGLTFAGANLGYGANLFYSLRTDPATGFTVFGTLAPPLLGSSADLFDLGLGGHNALAFTGTDVGFGVNKMYYERLDPVTGFTILGTLDPLTGRASDVANLGSVYATLDFVPGDVGFGTNQFYAAGAVNGTWQSVSFAAIADRAISAGPFTVSPSASSALPIALTVVPGSAGSASISGPVGGVFTVTPTAPGLITLQATQAGQAAPTAYEFNMLRQAFTATGAGTIITSQPVSQSAAFGSSVTFTAGAAGVPPPNAYQWSLGGATVAGATSSSYTIANATATGAGAYTVTASNGLSSATSLPATLTVALPSQTFLGSFGSGSFALQFNGGGTGVLLAYDPSSGLVVAQYNFAVDGNGNFSLTGPNGSALPAGGSFTLTGVASGSGVTGTITGVNGLTTFSSTGGAHPSSGDFAGVYQTGQLGASGLATFIVSGDNLVYGLVQTAAGPVGGTGTVSGSGVITLAATTTAGDTVSGTVASGGTATAVLTAIGGSSSFSGGTAAVLATTSITSGLGTAEVGTGDNSAIAGFVLAGPARPILALGLGPNLVSTQVGPVLQAPVLALYQAGTSASIASDTGWTSTPGAGAQSSAALQAAALADLSTGLTAANADSGILTNATAAGAYTVVLTGGAGLGEADVYDTGSAAAGQYLVNGSFRGFVLAGGSLVYQFHVVSSDGSPVRVLVRAVGPGLSAFTRGGAPVVNAPLLAAPTLTVYNQSNAVQGAPNTRWMTSPDGGAAGNLALAAASAGAFALQPASADSAMILTLAPGWYSASANAAGGQSGVVLIEVYRLL